MQKMKPGSLSQRITQKLQHAFMPSELEVIDDSSSHAGHAYSRPGGETHFRVRIVAEAFEGKSRIDRHRMINHVLAEELAGPVHALAITALSGKERQKE
jgi:BolA protein